MDYLFVTNAGFVVDIISTTDPRPLAQDMANSLGEEVEYYQAEFINSVTPLFHQSNTEEIISMEAQPVKNGQKVVHTPSGVQGKVYAKTGDGRTVISSLDGTEPIDMATIETLTANGWRFGS